MRQNWTNKITLEQKDFVKILCIGDSMTTAGNENSYPSKMEKFLNETTKNTKKFKVINKGLPGKDSHVILEHVDSWIKEYDPDIVICMIGLSDPNEAKPLTDLDSLPQKNILDEIKVLKLFEDLWHKAFAARRVSAQGSENSLNDTRLIHSKEDKIDLPKSMEPKDSTINAMPADLSFQQLKARVQKGSTMEVVMSYLEKAPAHYRNLYMVAMSQEMTRNYQDAEKLYFTLATNVEGVDEYLTRWMYERLGDVFLQQRKYVQTIPLFRIMWNMAPEDMWTSNKIEDFCKAKLYPSEMKELLWELTKKHPTNKKLLGLAAGCFQMYGDNDQAKKFEEKAYLLTLSEYNVYTQRNYLKLMDIVKNFKEIQLFIVQYPMRPINPLKKMLREKVNDQITFVDNEVVFKRAVAEKGYNQYFNDYYGGDFGHCTEEGNEMLASNIAAAVLSKISLK